MKLIPLTQGKFAKVDDADFEYLNQWKWHADKSRNTFYATRKSGDRNIKMHRVIMSNEIIDKIDHRDGDGLNNCRHNLRNSSNTQNMMNQRKRANCSSKYKGVSINIYNKTLTNVRGESKIITYTFWIANIRVQGRLLFLGRFKEEVDAALTYNQACIKYFGEFAKPNQIL